MFLRIPINLLCSVLFVLHPARPKPMRASGTNPITNHSIVNGSVDDVSFKSRPGRSEYLRPPRQTRTTGQT
ncbi:hypothetical protein CEP54_005656 [Fusarium duplospermum]|uniref:Secreted protein n=1 Tax=Fusarium duplospermum TaxID=1325734 RepID=A0A428QB13_9HYPO|nr:hypothetical protein CEP54_005656 [Fusarium duplospermum]